MLRQFSLTDFEALSWSYREGGCEVNCVDLENVRFLYFCKIFRNFYRDRGERQKSGSRGT